MANTWISNHIDGITPASTPTPKPTAKATPTVAAKPTYTQNLVNSNLNTINKVGNLNSSIAQSPLSAPTRMATAGLGKVGELLAKPSQFVESKLTGGKGYQDFYTNNPVGKTIVSAANNPIVSAVAPPAGMFKTPTRASFASSIALDPLNLVGAGVVSKASKVTGLGKLATKMVPVVDKIPGIQAVKNFIGKFQYGYGVESKFIKQYEDLQRRINKAGEFASEVAKPLKYGPDGKELPKAVQTLLGDVIRLKQEAPNRPLRPDELKALEVAEPILQDLFKQFDDLAKQQSKLGIDPETFSKLEGIYGGKRIFSKTYKQPGVGIGGTKIDPSAYIGRQNISEQRRMKLGEVLQPAYGAAVSAFTQKRNVEVLKFLRSVAKNAVSKQGYKALDAAEQAKYVLIPQSEKYGALAGSYIPEKVAAYINPLVERGGKDALEAFTKIWKTGKTILSPAQLARNMVTSQIQNYLENPSSLAYLPKAIKEKVTGGKFYKALENTGEINSTMPTAELGQYIPEELQKLNSSTKWQDIISRVWNMIKKPGSAVQNTNEQIAKTQSFIARLYDEAGKARITIDEALKRRDLVELARRSAESSGFNYQKVSPYVAQLRRKAVPFITYPIKAAELTAKTLTKHPERISALIKGENAVQSLTEDTKPNEKDLPSYLTQAVRVGNPNAKGVTPYINTKYDYPWGNMSDVVSGEGNFNPFTNIGIAPNPLITEAYSQAFKKDVFGQDIKEPVRHALETFGPSFVRSGFRTKDVLTKNPSSSTSPTLGTILTKEAGIPLYLYNPMESAKWQSYDKSTKLKELEAARRKFVRDYQGKISPEKMAKKMNEYIQMRREVMTSK